MQRQALATQSMEHKKDNPSYNPPKAKYKDISLFQINLDTKLIHCRQCNKFAPLSNNIMDVEVTDEIDQFKIEHEQCIIIHKAKLKTRKRRK